MYKILRRYENLKSGHCLAMYATRKRLPSRKFGWIIDMCIFKTQKQCDYWQRHQNTLPITQTNEGGLEGLVLVLKWIRELEESLPEGDIILVYWLDRKRKRAFRYLIKLGFKEGNYLGKDCYYLIKHQGDGEFDPEKN